MSLRKRIMAFLLAIVMVVSILPINAMADGIKTAIENGRKTSVLTSVKDSNTPETLDDYKVWETFEFGKYPKTKLTDSDIIAALNNEAAGKNGYYKYKNDQYAKVSGSYYKVEPIVWRVAKYYDDKSMIIMSDYVIDCQVFNDTSVGLSWEKCTLRKWLNEDFFNKAFNASEKAVIREVTNDNSAKRNALFNYSTPDTKDKVFLFSHGDLTDSTYNFNTNDQYDDPQRRSESTAYAQALGAGPGYCNYWTRSHNSTSVQYVLTGDGCVGNCHSPVAANSTGYGVRPVMVVDKDSALYHSVNKIGESITATFYNLNSVTNSINFKDDKKRAKTYDSIKNKAVIVTGGTKSTKYTTNKTGTAEIKLPEVDDKDRISLHIDGFYDYIAPAETFTETNKTIKLKQLDKERSKPYVSTVFVKESKYRYWESEKVVDSKHNTKYDIVVSANWNGHKADKYVLAQRGVSVLTSDDGYFNKVDIASSFEEGATIYAYCIAKDGVHSPTFETSIEVKATGVEAFTDKDATVSLFGEDGFKYTINKDIPIVGGTEVGMSLCDLPVSVIVDGDKVMFTIGLTLYENKSSSSLSPNASLGDICTNGKTIGDNFKELKECITGVDAVGKSIYKKGFDDWNESKGTEKIRKEWKKADNYYRRLNSLRKNLDKKTMSGRIIGKQSVEVEAYGYWEGNLTSSGLVQKEGKLVLKVNSSTTFTHMYLLGGFPLYSSITGAIELAGTTDGKRTEAKLGVPFEYEMSLRFVPSISAALGVGIPKYLSAEVSATGSLPIDLNFTKKYIDIELIASMDFKVKAWLFSYDQNIVERKWKIVSEPLTTKKSAQKLNSPLELSEEMFTSLAPRNDCQWVVGSSSTPRRLYANSNCGLSSMTLQKDSCKSKILKTETNGVKLTVTVQDVSSRASADRTQVSYSITNKNGTISSAKPVDNADLLSNSVKTADFLPSVVASGKNIYIAWQNTSKSFADVSEDQLTVEDYSKNAEICIAKYDTTTGKMSDKVTLTNDEVLDTLPVVVADSNGGATVVWVSNSAASFFETEGTNSIKYCTISSDMKPGVVKTVATGIHPVQDIDAIYNGQNLLVVTAQDTNNDISDNADMEIFQYTVNALGATTAQRLSNNTTIDSSPTYKRNGGIIQLFWYEDQKLKLQTTFAALKSGSNTKTLLADEESTADALASIEMYSDDYDITYNENGQGYIVWCQPVGEHVELYGSYYDGEKWSDAFPISHLEQKISDPSATCNDDGSLTVLCNMTNQTLVEGETLNYWKSGETDMVMLTYLPGPDLTLDSTMAFDEAEIKAGDTISIPLTVKNNGMACDGFTVSINDEQVYTYSNALDAGASVEIEIPYTYPDQIEHTTLNIKVASADGSEINSADNSIELEYGFANLRLSEISVDDFSESAVLGMSVENRSNIGAGEGYVAIYEKDADGQEITTFGFDSMEAWHYGAYTVPIDKDELTFDESGTCVLYAELTDEDGNVIDSEKVVIEKHIYTGTNCEVIDTTVSDGVATVFGVIKNDTDDLAQGFLTVSAVDSDGNVIASNRQFLDIEEQDSYNFEVELNVGTESEVAEYKAEFEACGRLYDYSVSDENTITIEKYYGQIEDLEIPDMINSLPVTAIAAEAFSGNKTLKHAKIPESVVSIGAAAFRDDTALEEIRLGANVASLGDECYTGCVSVRSITVTEGNKIVFAKNNILYAENGERLIFASSGAPAQLVLDDNVKIVDKHAFSAHKNLESIKFNDGLEKIGEAAFADSTKLKEIIIPDSVTSIGIYAFKNCSSVTVINTGNGVKKVNAGVFAGCTGLKSLTIGESVTRLASECFADCKNLEVINLNAKELEQLTSTQKAFVNAGVDGNGITVNVDNKVNTIPAYFFSGSGKYAVLVKKLDAGSAKLTIGEQAFSNVTTLEEVTNSENVIGIGKYAFNNCSNLKSIDLSKSKLREIEENTFNGCSSLESVLLPETGVTEIGGYAFADCEKLKNFSLPESVQIIRIYAFRNCKGLSELSLSGAVTLVEANAFDGCTGVTVLKLDCNKASFGGNVFRGLGTATAGTAVSIGDAMTTIHANLFAGGNKITDVYIGKSITTIGSSAFSGCSWLKHVSGCRSVKAVEAYAFDGCTSLETIALTDKIQSIGAYAFNNCSNLKDIELGNSMTRLPAYAFANSGIVDPVLPASLESIGERCFYGCSGITAITLPEGLKSIGKEAFSRCSGLEEIAIPNSVKTLGSYAFANNAALKKAQIGTDITTLSDYAFASDPALEVLEFKNPETALLPTAIRGCTKLSDIQGYLLEDGILYNKDKTELVGVLNSSMAELVVPDTVTKIWGEAFRDCSIGKAVISDSVTDIGDYAFYGCNMNTLELGRSIVRIGDYAFYGNTRLTAIELPNSLRSIGDNAFYNCSSLTELTIPNSVETIGECAFYGCTSLGQLKLGENVSKIGASAFFESNSLTSLTIPDSVKTIGANAFARMYLCTEITIGKGVESIGSNAFERANALEKLYFNAESCADFNSSYNPFIYAGYNSKNTTLVLGDSVKRVPGNFTVCTNSGYRPYITSIQFGNEIKEIGAYAFCDLDYVTWSTLSMPKLKSLGDYAMYSTEITGFELPSLESIGQYGFGNCTELKSVVLPDSMRSVGSYAFNGCSALEMIDFGNGKMSIGEFALNGCTAVTSLTLGEGIEKIDSRAFNSLSKLTQLNYNIVSSPELPSDYPNNALFYSLGNSGNGVTVNVGENVESIPAYLFYPYRGNTSYPNRILEVNIAADEIEIGNYAFDYCTLLKTVNANKISSVGDLAFYNCPISSFDATVIGDIGDSAFASTNSLEGLTLGQGVMSIGDRAFASSKITEMVIPDSVKSIGEYAFNGCTAMKNLTLGEGIEKIGRDAFCNLTNLTQLDYNIINYPDLPSSNSNDELFYMLGYNSNGVTVNVGKNVERIPAYLFCPSNTNYPNRIIALSIAADEIEIGRSAFYNCTSLKTVNANSMGSVGKTAFYNCPISSFDATVIGDIGDSAFASTGSLEGLALGYGVTSIGSQAFASSKITEMVIPDSVKSIGEYAFNGCTAMKNLTLGEGIEKIGRDAFCNLTNLTQLDYNIINYPDLPSSNSNDELFYMLGYNSNGVTVNVGKNVERIPAYLFCPSNTNYPNRIIALSIAADEIEIGRSAFYNCTSLKTVNANSMGSVGKTAFYNCPISSFDATVIGDIGDSAFASTGSLEGLTLGYGVTSVGRWAFGDSKITEMVIPDSVKSIGEYAFSGCNAMTSLTLGEGIEKIGRNAFYNLANLTELNYNIVSYPDLPSANSNDELFYMLGYNGSGVTANIGDNVERIPAYLFCPSNTNYPNRIIALNCGNGLESIGTSAFNYCTSLKSLVLNKDLKVIEKYAFNNTALTEVNVPKSTEIGEKALGYNGSSVKSGFKMYGFTGSPAEEYASNAKISWNDLAPMADEIQSIAIAEGDSGTIHVGDTIVLHEITSPVNALFSDIEWSSSNNAVATVSENGVVRGVKEGTAVITVKTANGAMTQFALHVNKGIDISGARIDIEKTYDYTGSEITPAVRVVFQRSVIPEKYYTVAYKNNKDIGTATLTVTADGKYIGTISGSFEIICRHPNADEEILVEPSCTKTGKVKINCPLCGVLEEELPKADHVAGEWIVDVPATTTSEGTQHRECINCGIVLDNGVISKIIDNTPPTGTITIGDSAWDSFISSITFGIISGDSKEVTITAKDENSGVKSVEYIISNTALSKQQLESRTDWTNYDKPFAVGSADGKNVIVYARITDNGGNVAIISSNGIVFDCAPPVISGVEDGKTYCISAQFAVTDDNLKEVKIDGETVGIRSGYFVDTAGKHTVTAEDAAGNTSEISFTVNEDHYSGTWVIDKAATEAESGVRHLECVNCGKVMFTEHYKYTDTEGYCKHECSPERISPTCTQGGYTKYTCVKCGFSYIADKTEAIGHIEVIDRAVSPTYTETGLSEGSHCRLCGEILKPQETVPVLKLGHPGVTAERNENGKPLVKWSSVDGAAKYEVWTSEGMNDHYVLLCTTAATEYVHEDATIGALHYYKVRALTSIDTEGDFSNEAFVICVCSHTFDAWKQIKAPTCTEKGSESRSCTSCGESEEREISALGHDIIHHDGKAATCTEKGWTAYDTCSRCDYSTYKEVPATGHHHNGVVTAPTCTEKGYTTHTCTCGDSYVDSYTDALGHDYGAWKQTKAPTCTAKGTEARACTRCNAAETREVASLGHAIVHHDAKAATCTEKGWQAYDTCSRCNYSTYKVIAALGHSYANGKCTRCGAADPNYNPAPAAPVLKITTVSGKPKISWGAVDGAVKYWIYRSTDGKNFKYYDSTTKTSYTNNSATVGTTYYYKVKAVNANGIASDYSVSKSIQCKPAAPTVSINRSNGKPKLSWKAVTGATKYWIYRSTDGVNFKYFDSTTKTTYTNSGAASGTKYYYRVKAVAVVNGKNVISANSSTKSLMTSLAKPSVSITTSNGKPKLTWKAVTGADKYYIYRSTDGKNFSFFDSTTKTTYVNGGAKKNTKYYYKVKAVCASNSSANSAQSTAVSITAR